MNKIIRSLLLQLPEAYKLIHNLKNNYLISFYLKKVHEPDFNAFKLICHEQSQLFLDIGANVGMSALSFFTLKSNAKVISFEPNPVNYPYLNKIGEKFDNFQYMPVGLGDKSDFLDFYFPIYNGKEMTALGSCDYEKAKSWLNHNTVYFFDASKLKMEKIRIEIKTLDSFQLQPDFIKIDVEGFEHQVLLGAKETINKFRPILLIEGVAQGDKVDQLLEEWGYAIYQFNNNQFHLNQFNCPNNFFVPQEKTELIKPYLA
ncbi:MAG: FkbM family methyltransferase [Pleurocapsa sp.]